MNIILRLTKTSFRAGMNEVNKTSFQDRMNKDEFDGRMWQKQFFLILTHSS